MKILTHTDTLTHFDTHICKHLHDMANQTVYLRERERQRKRLVVKTNKIHIHSFTPSFSQTFSQCHNDTDNIY